MLGQGGFGITYVAWDTKLKARVAVKEYMPNDICTPPGKHRLRGHGEQGGRICLWPGAVSGEARTLAKFMGQPNIAGVTDYFDENGTSYFVMDYIEGISL